MRQGLQAELGRQRGAQYTEEEDSEQGEWEWRGTGPERGNLEGGRGTHSMRSKFIFFGKGPRGSPGPQTSQSQISEGPLRVLPVRGH